MKLNDFFEALNTQEMLNVNGGGYGDGYHGQDHGQDYGGSGSGKGNGNGTGGTSSNAVTPYWQWMMDNGYGTKDGHYTSNGFGNGMCGDSHSLF